MGDNRKRIVAPSIASTSCLRAIHHVSHAFLTWPSYCAIPGDVTRTRTALRSLPRRRNRLCHHRDSLHASHAAHRPPCTCSHGDTCFPNLNNPICPHFSRQRWYLVPGAERFKADSRSCKRAHLGRPQNTGRTSHTAPRGAGAVSKTILRGPLGLPFPSVTRPTSPVWVAPCPISSYALTHANTLWDIHIGCLC